MKLSIVATLFQSSQHVAEFVERSKQAASKLVDDEYELVLVNDGSPDDSLAIAIELSEKDPHLIVIDLSRNFGHHKAMMTGLINSCGDKVFLVDSDLEELPEWVIDFYDKFSQVDTDVVYGVQAERKGNKTEKVTGDWFYSAMNALTGLNLPKNIVTARLMSRRYVDALVQHRDREVFLAGLWHITGFNQHHHTVIKTSSSTTTYTLRKKLSILVNSVTSFSNAPLKAIFYIGATISAASVFYILLLVYNKIFISEPLSGWTSVMASLWLLGGLIISFLGVIGIYLSKIFSETKDRPYTVIRHIYGKK